MDDRPIGVFDSGLGGLTAVRSLRQILPEENLIYFGDTARVPYGGRSRETLLKYARQDVRFLRSFDLKAILIACGTVSTTALPTLAAENDLPIVGVVEPTCRRAVAVTRNRRVGMIATLASVRSGAYEAQLQKLDPAVQVIAKPCPLFVPLVENGRFAPGDVVIETVAREYLEPLRDTGIDTLILGCTHYPLLWDVIHGVMGPGVTLVSAGEESAFELKRLLTARDARADPAPAAERRSSASATGWRILSASLRSSAGGSAARRPEDRH
jgi:glutamate racemase